MTFPMCVATLAWLLYVIGLVKRSNRRFHVTCMLSGASLDLGLVLVLQVQRSAVQTALQFSLGILEQIHILFSTLSILTMIPTVVLGLLLLKGKESIRSVHRKFALSTFFFRTLGFVFMFSMWQ